MDFAARCDSAICGMPYQQGNVSEYGEIAIFPRLWTRDQLGRHCFEEGIDTRG
jgi:hypothetical protein